MFGNIHSIETFGTVDGPGVRFVIFMRGCPLRCAYCHNPDTWQFGRGTKMSTDTLVNEIFRYRNYIEGVTVTGGEPLAQIDFVIELFEKVKERGLSTCVDTSGITFNRNEITLGKMEKLLEVCDLVMLDIKHIDSAKHKALTSVGNENILDFATYLSDSGKDMWLRYVLIPNITDNVDDLKKWSEFTQSLKNVKKIEVLPYHTMGVGKYEELGIDYPLKGVREPTKEEINKAEKILKGRK